MLDNLNATVVIGVSTITATVGVGLFYMASKWAEGLYDNLWKNPTTECDIDSFVSMSENPPNKLKVCLAHTLRMGSRTANTTTPIPLECTKSPHVKGLYVSRKVQLSSEQSSKNESEEMPTPLNDLLPRMTSDGKLDPTDRKKTVVVATIRMGFGHHRLAYSACSWALENGYRTIFHDLINIESEESDLIHSMDSLYSKFSRLASELGGPIEKLWGSAMKQGDADALRMAALTAAHLQPLLLAYPKDIPLITTHQLCALVAAAAGFTNVVNLVVDNYPQWFLVVPRTLNLTQGPVNYQSFLRMGVKPEELKLAGHWCPTELVKYIPNDCKTRIQRATAKKPLRLLIPVGGAGAQKKFIGGMIQECESLLKSGKVQILLNAGDHAHMKTAFVQTLQECGIDYDTVATTQGVYDFQKNLLAGNEPSKNVTLFAFTEYFPAVATTDILCRAADVLCCKPSELAFYPLPKLHIRRVGDHEADSARRAAEAGDGSLEAREISDAKHLMELMLKTSDLVVSMNEAVIQNNTIGMYDGCKNSVTWAMERYLVKK